MAVKPKTIANAPTLWLDKWPVIDAQSHKYSRGHTMIVGGETMTGAAHLSALAAARIGSGLTSLLVPESAFSIYASAMLSILVKPFADDAAFSAQINNAKINSFLIGPGAGVNEQTRWQTLALLQTHQPVVLDADALSVFEGNLPTLQQAIQGPCVMTPHEGEFKRLFDWSDDRVENAKNAASLMHAVVVLKGADTIIADPSGEVIINKDAPATLATGGSGDVLAGLIAGLLAQGMPAFYAAAAATWVHSEAAKLFGIGLIADDLPDLIPKVMKQLNLNH